MEAKERGDEKKKKKNDAEERAEDENNGRAGRDETQISCAIHFSRHVCSRTRARAEEERERTDVTRGGQQFSKWPLLSSCSRHLPNAFIGRGEMSVSPFATLLANIVLNMFANVCICDSSTSIAMAVDFLSL